MPQILEGVKLARQIGRSAPLAAPIAQELSPGADVAHDQALASVIERDLDTYHHGTSAVPMGADNDSGAVVDSAGRVLSLRGLRVIDASIMPEIPSTPTNLTTIMLAEHIVASEPVAACQPAHHSAVIKEADDEWDRREDPCGN